MITSYVVSRVAFLRFSLSILFISTIAFGAGQVDPTFNAGAFLDGRGIYAMQRQNDGKMLIGGLFDIANGRSEYSIARINDDSTPDTTFSSPFGPGEIVRAIAVQPDGKILVGGDLGLGLIARLNPDGSFDNSFVNDTLNGSGSILDIAVDGNGRIVIAGSFTYQSATGVTKSKFACLNPDGTTDITFAPAGQFTDIYDIEIQPDGKVVGATTDGGPGSRFIKRFEPDGTEDASFNTLVTVSSFSLVSPVTSIKVLQNDQILVGGNFDFINNIPRTDAARLNSDGSLDTSFNVTTDGEVQDIDTDTEGRILIGGRFGMVNEVAERNLARLDTSGTVDPSFRFNPLTAAEMVTSVLPRPDGKIDANVQMIGGGNRIKRFEPNGALDDSFLGLAGTLITVRNVISQPDGKILVAGDFSAVDSSLRNGFARLNSNGSVDRSFDPQLNIRLVFSMALQVDGKIVVGGDQAGDPNLRSVRRVNPNGTLDAGFAPNFGFDRFTFADIAVQPDGKIVFIGTRNSAGFVGRLNSNGSLDAGFAFTINGNPLPATGRVVVQPDGKVLIAGDFTLVNGIPRGRVARLNADGTIDASFNPLGGANNVVYAMAIQPDGKILAGGAFMSFNGSVRDRIARLNPDGTLDQSFAASADNVVRTITLEPSGKIILGGDFTAVNGTPKNRVARLNADGTLDNSFDTGAGSGLFGSVNSLALQPDNKVVIGGAFFSFGNVPNASIARLLNDAPRRTSFDFDGDGRADIAVFRPSNGYWYISASGNGSFSAVPFGLSADRIAPADYDGDGRSDVAVFRDTVPGAGSLAYFFITNSSDNSFRPVQFGSTADLPVPGDWDGDGQADVAVYRDGSTSGGQSFFFYRPSASPGTDFNAIPWGTAGDKPLVGDFDGDGRQDAAVFRPSNTTWYILRSSDGQVEQHVFGAADDVPAPADFDGDGSTDIAVFRPSNGTWYTSFDPLTNYGAIYFGTQGDIPVPADYDGDGRSDAAVFRPSTGIWYKLGSTNGFDAYQWGVSGDVPAPSAFLP